MQQRAWYEPFWIDDLGKRREITYPNLYHNKQQAFEVAYTFHKGQGGAWNVIVVQKDGFGGEAVLLNLSKYASSTERG